MTNSRFIELSWAIIEYKVMYYRPEVVHKSWHTILVIPDELYDQLERQYLMLCCELDRPNTVVHKDYPGFEGLEGSGMMELDTTRPSVQLVFEKLKKKCNRNFLL